MSLAHKQFSEKCGSLSSDDLNKIRALLYKETGMLFDDKKNYYIESRVKQRLDVLKMDSFNEYYNEVAFGNRQQELKALIETITINETYFFRDFPQLQGFAEQVLVNYSKEKIASGSSTLSAWSAACSTGEEPYTLAIIFKEILNDLGRFEVKIDATDIDSTVLAKASAGLFSERSMKDTPLIYKNKYFIPNQDEWKLLDPIKKMVTLRELNLIDRSEMRKMRNYDFIFCRNVLIYFDDDSRRKVVASLYDALVPGGYLFLGHSESIGRISAAFELQNIGGFLCYRRPK